MAIFKIQSIYEPNAMGDEKSKTTDLSSAFNPQTIGDEPSVNGPDDNISGSFQPNNANSLISNDVSTFTPNIVNDEISLGLNNEMGFELGAYLPQEVADIANAANRLLPLNDVVNAKKLTGAIKDPVTINDEYYDSYRDYNSPSNGSFSSNNIGKLVFLWLETFQTTDDIESNENKPKDKKIKEKPDFIFDVAIIDIVQPKNIITTNILGKKGTVKEYVAWGDFEITINATILGQNGRYPKDKMTSLLEFLNYNAPIKILNTFLNVFYNVNYIVIKDYKLSFDRISQQNITINCISDDYFDNALNINPYVA